MAFFEALSTTFLILIRKQLEFPKQILELHIAAITELFIYIIIHHL